MDKEFDEFAAGLADDLNQALKDGTFNVPPEEKTLDPEIQRSKNGLMINFIRLSLPFHGLEQLKKQHISINLTGVYFADRFKKWQDESKRKGGPDGEIIKSITLKELADCARERFEEFSKAAGQAVIDSPRHGEMLERADYWSFTEQVIKEASEGQNKNPLI